jgi:hypothetical protein
MERNSCYDDDLVLEYKNQAFDVSESINTHQKIKESGYDLIPSGTFILGTSSTPPDGYSCNGNYEELWDYILYLYQKL